jgi:hypothetical protein
MREWAGTLFAAALAGCAEQGGRATIIQRDSAGVVIVESLGPAIQERLTIPPDAVLDIGGQSDGNPKTEFIGPVSAVRMSNGLIVAAGWAATELQVFDSAGQWVRSIGRQGSGPGEFVGLGYVYLTAGQELVTYEPGSRRIQLFDSTGSFRRLTSLSASPDQGSPGVVGALAGGALLVRTSAAIDSGQGGPLVPNRHRYYRLDPVGGRYDFLVEVEGPVYIRHPANPQYRVGILPFAPGRPAVPLGSSVVTLTRAGFGVEMLDSNGKVYKSVRRKVEVQFLKPEDRQEAAREVTVGMDPILSKAVREVIAGSDIPSTRPAVAGLAATPEGLIFLQHFESPHRPGRVASIFGPGGHWIQDIELPIPFYVSQAGRDFLLGTYEDPTGFYHIVLAPLTIRF